MFHLKLFYDIMKNSFLSYYKMVLEKVSFHPRIFRKELKKAFTMLSVEERDQLKQWIRNSQN